MKFKKINKKGAYVNYVPYLILMLILSTYILISGHYKSIGIYTNTMHIIDNILYIFSAIFIIVYLISLIILYIKNFIDKRKLKNKTHV